MANTFSLSTAKTGRGMKALLLVGLALGYFMVLLDTSIVNVALPAIQKELNGGLVGLQWVLNSYTLVFASLLLTAGALTDMFGAKRVFIIGLVIFLIASALSAVTPSLSVLIALRAILGIGGAAILPASLSLISHAFTDPIERARSIGIWGAITGAAMVAGPVLGGVLVDTLGWRSIFLINVPIALVGLVIVALMVSETPRREQKGIDLGGQITAIIAIAAFTFGLVESETFGWLSPIILLSFAITLISLLAFILIEARGRAPMLPLSLFRNPIISAGMLAGIAVNFALGGLLFVLALYFQQELGYTALLAGLGFLPLTIPMTINAVLTGRIVGRFGARLPITIGFVLATAGFFLMAWVNPQTGYLLILLSLLLIGPGFSSIIPALISAVMGAASKEQVGIASGALNSSRQLGSALSVAIFGALLTGSSDFVTGMHISLFLTAAILLATGAFAVWQIRRR